MRWPPGPTQFVPTGRTRPSGSLSAGRIPRHAIRPVNLGLSSPCNKFRNVECTPSAPMRASPPSARRQRSVFPVILQDQRTAYRSHFTVRGARQTPQPTPDSGSVYWGWKADGRGGIMPDSLLRTMLVAGVAQPPVQTVTAGRWTLNLVLGSPLKTSRPPLVATVRRYERSKRHRMRRTIASLGYSVRPVAFSP